MADRAVSANSEIIAARIDFSDQAPGGLRLRQHLLTTSPKQAVSAPVRAELSGTGSGKAVRRLVAGRNLVPGPAERELILIIGLPACLLPKLCEDVEPARLCVFGAAGLVLARGGWGEGDKE